MAFFPPWFFISGKIRAAASCWPRITIAFFRGCPDNFIADIIRPDRKTAYRIHGANPVHDIFLIFRVIFHPLKCFFFNHQRARREWWSEPWTYRHFRHLIHKPLFVLICRHFLFGFIGNTAVICKSKITRRIRDYHVPRPCWWAGFFCRILSFRGFLYLLRKIPCTCYLCCRILPVLLRQIAPSQFTCHSEILLPLSSHFSSSQTGWTPCRLP